MRETDPAQFPFRRVTVAGFASLMVGVIFIAGFAVYALFTGGSSDTWKQQAGAVLLEKGNGALYVYKEKEGGLHPVRNLASALLYAGGSNRNIVTVSSKSLSGVPRGAMVGIPDAPDAVPTPDQLVDGAWTACSVPVPETGADEGGHRSLLAIGNLLGVADGGTPLGDDTGIAVRTPNSPDAYLLWHQRKFLMAEVNAETLLALGFNADPQRLPIVDLAFLNAFEAGDPIRPPAIQNFGEQSPVGKNGKLFSNKSAAGLQFFVISGNKVEQITQVQASLLAPRTEIPSVTTVPGDTPGNRLLPQGPSAMPSAPLKPVDIADGSLCATAADDSGFQNIRYGVPTPDVSGLVRTAGRTDRGTALADYVAVQPGRGVLVEGYTVAKTSSGVTSLVTDIGQQFPIADKASKDALGFANVTAAPMPVKLVSLLPQGSELSQKAAASTITLD
jgi:type VII secretion protein EccB